MRQKYKVKLLLLIVALAEMQCDGQNAPQSKTSPSYERGSPMNKMINTYSLSEIRSLSDIPTNVTLVESGRIEAYKYDPDDKKKC